MADLTMTARLFEGAPMPSGLQEESAPTAR